MKAAFINRYGGPEVLEIGERPRPEIGPHDLLVEVKAAGVNPVDFKIRSGQLKPILDFPFPLTLGCDVSGVVVEAGKMTSRFKAGDEIFACLERAHIGAFAEFAVVRENDAALKPPRLSHFEAASIPLVGLTAWQALRDVAGIRKGQNCLIHAGSGGVGSFAIQLAVHIGANVATTVSARNFDLARRLGAKVVVDYRNQRFEDGVRNCDVVIDTLGGETRLRSFKVVKPGGILVTIAGIPTAKQMREWEAPFWTRWYAAFANRKSTQLARSRKVRFEYLSMQGGGAQLQSIAHLLSSSAILPIVDKVFPLDKAREAIAYCEAGHAVGKVVIQP